VHAEVHVAQSVGGEPVVIPAPPGLHARYLTTIAAEICATGIDVVVVDLPGHGLSTGKRGHADGRAIAGALEAAADYARSRFLGEPHILAVGNGAERLAHGSGWLRKLSPAASSRTTRQADGLLPRKVHCDNTVLGRLPYARTAREAVSIARSDRRSAGASTQRS
jgi:UDP-glucose 4-epimerase